MKKLLDSSLVQTFFYKVVEEICIRSYSCLEVKHQTGPKQVTCEDM